MRLIKKLIHEDVEKLEGKIFKRRASRGIILKDSKILLLYTKRYNDYSFPGGGVDEGEDLITGLKRELVEEVGAQNIEVLDSFGYIDEFRPHYKPQYDFMHMLSYFYVCKIDNELQQAKLESHEIANGMSPVWIDIDEAIKHNKEVMKKKEASMGMSIERETLALELVAKELVFSTSGSQ